MQIYHLLIEGKPSITIEETQEIGGAFVNVWVRATDRSTAKAEAINYLNAQDWEVVNIIEEKRIVRRIRYIDVPESLECYDEAIHCGIGALFHIWRSDAVDHDEDPRSNP